MGGEAALRHDSDFLPLFGYRRRSYLLLANVGAVAAFLWTTQVAGAGRRSCSRCC